MNVIKLFTRKSIPQHLLIKNLNVSIVFWKENERENKQTNIGHIKQIRIFGDDPNFTAYALFAYMYIYFKLITFYT